MKDNSPRLSVIVPCYNSAEYLPECLDSLAVQKEKTENIEIILVDDASADNGRTVSLLYDFQKKYPQTKVICHDENRRQGGARNTGVAASSGEYVGFVDADDHLSLDYSEKVLLVASETDADIVQFGHYQYVTDESQEQKIVGRVAWKQEDLSIDSAETRKDFIINGQMTLGHWNKIYRRSMLINAGVQFRENSYYEEPSFTYPLKYYVNKFAATQECLLFNHLRENSGLHGDMKNVTTIMDHVNQWLEIYDKMRAAEFYCEFSQEIDFSLIHSLLLETLVFCGQRGFCLSLAMYEDLRRHFIKRIGDSCNKYVSPGSIYNTLIGLMEKDNMNQETLNEITDILKEI